ncbi:uncharacterized protein PAE49_002534 [Odontesthes bonariensis]|uniref:uncharacterized protein LOC142377041 n=1 Tax=Odontesthes bonariensis TaxID=219752 RepID=UPI003F58E1FF
MMEFWSENQGQSHLYSRFGTLPGRSCAHNHHDRHQATHYPLYYGEKQDQGSYWTVPGSGPGGVQHEYTNWTDQELTASPPSHFPFNLNRQTQHHQSQGEYHHHEARDREWALFHRAPRDYERGFLREGWQRRWEPGSPVRYNREVSAKRSDSSYRELEAWAARYSHSLPRRRRPEAELRGASQGLVESSRAPERASRSGTDPVAALQHVQQNPNSRVSGLWDRQQAPTYYPSHAPVPDTSHILNMKENTWDQRRMFSQPPGYITPPPYNSPHKGSPVMQQCDTSWEQGGKRQAYRPQATLRRQDVSGNLQDKRKVEKEERAKPDERTSCSELEGLKHRRQESGALQGASPMRAGSTNIQSESALAQQHPQGVGDSKINQETTSKVIEGRKFRLNKKTGGMTIFCLVSRIAGVTETPSLPLFPPQMNIQSPERGEVSTVLRDRGEINQTDKLADEVDFRAPTLPEQSNTSDVPNHTATQTLTCTEMEKPGDYLPNKTEADIVSAGKSNTEDGDSVFGRQTGQLVQSAPIKYPLWREPSSTIRAENESPPTCCSKDNGEEEESGGVLNHDAANISSHPTDTEIERVDMEEDTEETKGLLIIDTTSVVVKMELIPSPKREHVHYLDYSENIKTIPFDNETTVSSELNCQPNQDVTVDQNVEATLLQTNEEPETDLDLVLLAEEKHEGDSEVAFPSKQPSPVSERETLEERAERILGISLDDHVTEQKPEDEESFHHSDVEEEDEEAELPPSEQTEEDTLEKLLETVQPKEATGLKDTDDIRNQVTNEHTEDFAGSQEQVADISVVRNTHSQLEVTEDPQLESTCEKCRSVQGQDEIKPIYVMPSETPDLTNFSSLPLPDLTFPFEISELSTQEGPNPILVEISSAANHPPCPYPDTLLLSLDQLPSPPPSGSTHSSSSSTPNTEHLPSPPPPLDLIFQTADVVSGAKDQSEDGEATRLPENEVNIESLATDMAEEVVSQQHGERHQAVEATCATDGQQTNEADKDPGRGLEQRLETSKDKPLDVHTLTQQPECTQTESVTRVKESNLSEKQAPGDTNGDPIDPTTQISKTDVENEENASDGQTEVNILPQQCDIGHQEGAFCVKESGVTEDQSQINPTQLIAGLWEQSHKSATDSQTQMEIEILQDPGAQFEPSNSSPPSALDCEVSLLDELSNSELLSPPHAPLQSDAQFVPLLNVNLVCPSPPDPDTAAAGVMETVPHPPHLDSGEESGHFSFSSLCNSSPVLPHSSANPPQEENISPGSLSSTAHKEELQYPKSLWDVVNRIRKHTAPDSENEEEEVCELSDPESVGENFSCQDVLVDTKSEKIISDEAEQQKVSKDDDEMGDMQQVLKEPRGRGEEDTLSCSSSSSSHGSKDTVIVANEDRREETTLDAKTERDKESDALAGELHYSGEGLDETAGEESQGEMEDEADTSNSGQRQEYPAALERI